ncbi:MAG: tRNA lysidine(34) synthetase TilS, partial [Chloroflexus sp.]
RVEWPEWAAPAIAAGQAPLHGPPLLRPLLTISRAALAAYCAEHGLDPRQDPTNDDLRFIRSRIRHQLLPQLVAENRHITAALGRTARICAEDYDFIQQVLATQWPKLIVTRQRGLIVFDRAAMRTLHPALRRYALRRAITELGDEEPSFAQIDAALHMMAGPSGRQMQLTPHITLVCDQQTISLHVPTTAPPSVPQVATQVLLPERGSVSLQSGWRCVVQSHPPAQPDRWWLGLAQPPTGPLMLRPRRAGDRMRPAGAPGSRRLQDIFVDLHVPRALRDGWPLLVAADGQILWLAGLRVAAGIAAVEPNQATMWIGMVAPATKQE